jgi:hypothetical protein
MQRVGMRHPLAGIEVKPVLPALLARSRIPGNTQALELAVRKWNEILLQGKDSEGVRDRIIVKLTIRTVGANVKLVLVLMETRDYRVLAKACVLEIPEDRLVIRWLHGEGVMGVTPRLGFFDMARGATLLADISCCQRRAPLDSGVTRSSGGTPEEDSQDRYGEHREYEGAPRLEPPGLNLVTHLLAPQVFGGTTTLGLRDCVLLPGTRPIVLA